MLSTLLTTLTMELYHERMNDMTYDEEMSIFKRWLRKQQLNPLAELYALYLYFNVGGWDAVREWREAAEQQPASQPPAPGDKGEL